MAVEWSQLPPELVETISKSLKNYIDYLNCRATCRNWRSSIPQTPSHLPPQLPWLMVPQSQHNSSRRAFFNLSTNKFHFLNLPEASHSNRHCGSSHGWLTILDETPTVLLLNPISRANLYLPSLSTFPNVISFNYSDIGREYALRNALGDRFTFSLRQMRDSFIKKLVLSSSPLRDSNFMAVAILNPTGDLAYCKNGDQYWSIIESTRSFCEDVIYMNGSFFAVNKVGQIAVCDVSCDIAKVSFIETPKQIGGDMQYLVNSGDDLLLVTKYLDDYFESELPDLHPNLIYRTTRFEVFRLDCEEIQWVRVRSLGDKTLFIGENASLALSSMDFPGCVGNCIYFTDDYSVANYNGHFGEYDLGIFKLWDESFEPFPCYLQASHSRLQWPPPLWVSPNPC
ncbi:F-box protein SKIP23-like [Euphorbia lathyris]|uniref:F-box protein SKIP23-like n=1 Tax=Euphorbia lathyris TaxID=212925 RepID=UPI0033143206